MSRIPTAPLSATARSVVADPERLDAVHATGLLDTPPEERFDHLTRLAAEAVAAPAAFLSLVTEHYDFYKSAHGFPEPLASQRKLSGTTFCHYTIVTDGLLVLDDARKYPELRDVPTIQSLGVIAYVGIPLLSRTRQPLGAFCVIDHKPRQWRFEEIDSLLSLARTALEEIDHLPLASALETQNAVDPDRHVAEATLEWLYQSHASRIYSLLLQMLRSAPDAQDVLQETFVQAWQHFNRYDPRKSTLSGWLICIARSRAIDRMRQLKRRELLVSETAKQPRRDIDSQQEFCNRADLDRVRTVMGDLPDAQRSALELAYFGGMTHSEIATHTGAPVGTIKSRLLLGMNRLRQELATNR